MVGVAPPSLCEGGASKRSDASGGCSGMCGVQVVVDEDDPIPSACIPCEIRFALSRPLRKAKGRISPPPPFVPHFRPFPLTRNRLLISPWEGAVHSLTYDGFTVRSRAPSPCRERPLWIPAFAGMTVIVHSPLGGGGERDHPPTALSRHPRPARNSAIVGKPFAPNGKGVL